MKCSALLIVLAALGFAARAEAAPASSCEFAQLAELHVTMLGTRPVVTTTVNGVEARFLVDSGAFYSNVFPAAAKRLGLKTYPSPSGLTVRGIGGETPASAVTVQEFGLAGSKISKIEFLVTGNDLGGDIAGLLGQNILGAFDIEYDLANGVIRLFQAKGCRDLALVYWAKPGQSYSMIRTAAATPLEPHINVAVEVNGKNIRAIFDSGAPVSILSLPAAERAGVTPQAAGVVSGGMVGGVGPRLVDSWIAPFASFGIGDEEVRNTRLRIGPVGFENAEMLIGADFFLSHRLLVSNSQDRLYFTYNGGPVFRLGRVAETQTAAVGPAPGPAAESPGGPVDASSLSRRGAAFAARADYTRALADFDRAIALEPSNPQFYADRSLIRLRSGQSAPAMADLDKALALKPDHLEALLLRARVHFGDKDIDRARADIEAATRLAPDKDEVLFTAATAFAAAGLRDEAMSYYERLIDGHPKDRSLAMALNARCWTRATWGVDLNKALADCDAALKLRPRTSDILDSRGLVRLRLGQLDASIADYDAALKLQPKGAWSLYGRGLARQKKGMNAEAEADLKAAIALDGGIADLAKSYGLTP